MNVWLNREPTGVVGRRGRNPMIQRCDFKCLSNCPLLPGEPCLYDDPDIVDRPGFDDELFEAEFPDFSWWREFNEELVKPEPEDKHKKRCPRCFSTEVTNCDQFIFCGNCGYNEPLMDYPVGAGWRY